MAEGYLAVDTGEHRQSRGGDREDGDAGDVVVGEGVEDEGGQCGKHRGEADEEQPVAQQGAHTWRWRPRVNSPWGRTMSTAMRITRPPSGARSEPMYPLT